MNRYYVYVSGQAGVYVTAINEDEAVAIATANGDYTANQEVFAVLAEGENAE